MEVDKRTKEYKESLKKEPIVFEQGCAEAAKAVLDERTKESPFSKAENNPGWKLCMICGKELPPGDDGKPRLNKVPTPCYDCVWRNK